MRSLNPPSIVTIAILTTITIVFWIFFGVYRVLTSEVVVNVPSEALAPINPTLDQSALGKLEERIFFEKNETIEFKKNPEQSAVTPQPTEAIPTPSPSEEVTETLVPSEEIEEASPEANLES